MWNNTFLNFFIFTTLPGDYFWLFKYIKVDKNVSRYCNKDIKVISVQAIFVTLCQLWKWFSMLRKLCKPSSRKSYQNLRKLQGKYLRRSFVIVKSFFVVQYTRKNLICSLTLKKEGFYTKVPYFLNFKWEAEVYIYFLFSLTLHVTYHFFQPFRRFCQYARYTTSDERLFKKLLFQFTWFMLKT